MSGHREQGSVLIVILFCLVSIVSVCALAIDGWRAMLLVRQAQDLADLASLAGMNQLQQSGLNELDNWQNVKKAVLASLDLNNHLALSVESSNCLKNKTAYFQKGATTLDDISGYNFDTAQIGESSVKVSRGIVCFIPDAASGTMQRVWYSLEGVSDSYCQANAITVELNIKNVNASFSQIFGFNWLPEIHVTARSQRKSSNSCGLHESTLCSTYGTLDLNVGEVDPDTGIFIPKFVPTPC